MGGGERQRQASLRRRRRRNLRRGGKLATDLQELQREMLGLPSAAARVDSHPCKVSGRPHTSAAEQERGTTGRSTSSCIGHRFVGRQALPCGAMPALPSGCSTSVGLSLGASLGGQREIHVAQPRQDEQPITCAACKAREQKGGVVWLALPRSMGLSGPPPPSGSFVC